MKFKRLIVIIGIVLGCWSLNSCQYEKIKPIDTLPEDISLSENLIPMFNIHCNTSGCHGVGEIPPDLSAQNAYSTLTTGTKWINLTSPEESLVYKRMIDQQKPMPLTGVLPYEASMVLSWITDGAPDN